ncbi:hypothetical protein LPJ78_002938 [Coemansia sp. RSA 989]|nr:hypothetical protein LPJ79_002869 [Coemansia sp. RSA 1821]KAJ1865047.1 hypothetical protein LPJ78_002938 [Coemansia sp. RSA 989]KAJ1872404.1 hypothetical protein LPJ55_003098 [Coemansia sp. RSA 990]KAJ2631651.1 hypothetical protein H4R22_001826 [Coemansia sp. RSA 1290]KAJ2652710.1 hypothetical protein IWW40_000821 [Coemansia sp. RSA 1250]KAJ2675316.1 hypothetical protein IWW42_001100 [Coemansia sp. RSA 1085]
MASFQMISRDPARMRTTYGYKVDGHEVSRGCLDMEWISAVVRNTTLSMASPTMHGLETVTLSVNTVQPILVGTAVLIECQLLQQATTLKAQVVIRNANLPHTIYATGTHIMAFRGTAARL